MAQDADDILVAARGDINIAPVGTTLPTDETTTLDNAFINLGYTTEEGSSLTYGQTTEDIMAWQSASPVRRIRTGSDLTVTFNLIQFNRPSFELAFGGGTWSNVGSSYRYDPPDEGDALAEYTLVVDWEDGDKSQRLVVERATVSEDVTTQLIRTAAAVLPISMKSLKPDSGNSSWFTVSSNIEYATAS